VKAARGQPVQCQRTSALSAPCAQCRDGNPRCYNTNQQFPHLQNRLGLNQDAWLHPSLRDLAKRVEEQKSIAAEHLFKTLDVVGDKPSASKKKKHSSPYCLWGSLSILKSGSP